MASCKTNQSMRYTAKGHGRCIAHGSLLVVLNNVQYTLTMHFDVYETKERCCLQQAKSHPDELPKTVVTSNTVLPASGETISWLAIGM